MNGKMTNALQAPGSEAIVSRAETSRVSCRATMMTLMRSDDGATAAELAAAVGWQVHSVRGFIAGTLKKRAGVTVATDRAEGATRYRLIETGAAR